MQSPLLPCPSLFASTPHSERVVNAAHADKGRGYVGKHGPHVKGGGGCTQSGAHRKKGGGRCVCKHRSWRNPPPPPSSHSPFVCKGPACERGSNPLCTWQTGGHQRGVGSLCACWRVGFSCEWGLGAIGEGGTVVPLLRAIEGGGRKGWGLRTPFARPTVA